MGDQNQPNQPTQPGTGEENGNGNETTPQE